jgi:hypothetical protein
MFTLPDQERLQAERSAARTGAIKHLTRRLEIEAPEHFPDVYGEGQDLVKVSGTAARRSSASARARLQITDTGTAPRPNPFDPDNAVDVPDPWEELRERFGKERPEVEPTGSAALGLPNAGRILTKTRKQFAADCS